MTLTALCEAAITVSSNLAANNLIERLGAAKIQRPSWRLARRGMQVKRGVEDQKAFDKGAEQHHRCRRSGDVVDEDRARRGGQAARRRR